MLSAACWLAPLAAFAEPGSKVEARRHFENGLAQVKNKAYGEAIAEFNQAYDLGHDFAVLYEIGQAYVAIDHPVFAVRTLKQYLGEGGKRIPAARRKQVEAEIAKQQGQIATVFVHATIERAVVKVDGVDVGRTPLPDKLEVTGGSHLISATAVGCRPWEQRANLPGGERRDIEIQFEAAEFPAAAAGPVAAAPVSPLATPATSAPPAPANATAAPAPTPPVAGAAATPAAAAVAPPLPKAKVAAYVLGGLGAGALVVGGVYGVRAISKRHDSDAACPKNQCSPAGVDLNNQAKSAALVADITIGVGLVSLAVATYLLLRSPPEQPSPATTSAKGVRMLADVRPGQAGLALRGSW